MSVGQFGALKGAIRLLGLRVQAMYDWRFCSANAIFSRVFKQFALVGMVMVLLRMLTTMAGAAPDFDLERGKMIAQIEDHFRRLGRFMDQGSGEHIGELGVQLRKVLADVPRHEFVPQKYQSIAYRDRPIPIGHGQTISQPVIVAAMTQLLNVKPDDVVLEVGTGSGYQAAVLSMLAHRVFSIEIIDALGRQAKETLARLGYLNVEVRAGDGYSGWPEHAPFDGIIVTAAPDHVPQPLIDQLKPGGRLVIPVGNIDQDLLVIEKAEDGTTQRRRTFSVRFVPLTREQ